MKQGFFNGRKYEIKITVLKSIYDYTNLPISEEWEPLIPKYKQIFSTAVNLIEIAGMEWENCRYEYNTK